MTWRTTSPRALGVHSARPGRTQRARWAYSARDDRTPRVPTARTLRHRRRRGPRQSPTTDTTGANVHAQHNRCSRHRLNHPTRTEGQPKPKAHAERAVSTGTAAPLGAFMVTKAYRPLAVGVPTARRGHTSRPPWAYRPLAVGGLAARRGRTARSPWAYQPPALGVLATRPGRTRPGPRSDSAAPHSQKRTPHHFASSIFVFSSFRCRHVSIRRFGHVTCPSQLLGW